MTNKTTLIAPFVSQRASTAEWPPDRNYRQHRLAAPTVFKIRNTQPKTVNRLNSLVGLFGGKGGRR